MKHHAFKPFLWLGLLIMIVGLACGAAASTPTAVPPTPEPPTAVPPTDTPVPTEIPATDTPVPTEVPPTDVPPTDIPATEVPPPTVPPANEAPAFYVEEFDSSSSSFYPSDYYYFIPSGPDNFGSAVTLNNGYLSFNIDTMQTYIYVYYGAWTYSDVGIMMEAENLGANSQYVSLFCRYNPDRGWIEFNIAGDGTYSILANNILEGSGYQAIYNGGSTAIKIGKQNNIYDAACVGDNISLFVNGTEVRTMAIPNAFRFLKEGYAGFSVGSERSTPVVVDINWFEIYSP